MFCALAAVFVSSVAQAALAPEIRHRIMLGDALDQYDKISHMLHDTITKIEYFPSTGEVRFSTARCFVIVTVESRVPQAPPGSPPIPGASEHYSVTIGEPQCQ
jgi:hypothetical protein